MSAWFLWSVTVLYSGAAVSFVMEGKPLWAVAFACYGVANIAVTYATR
jgi:hypothetical protein